MDIICPNWERLPQRLTIYLLPYKNAARFKPMKYLHDSRILLTYFLIISHWILISVVYEFLKKLNSCKAGWVPKCTAITKRLDIIIGNKIMWLCQAIRNEVLQNIIIQFPFLPEISSLFQFIVFATVWFQLCHIVYGLIWNVLTSVSDCNNLNVSWINELYE